MTIAYDAKRAFHNPTGLGNYSRVLIQSVHEALPDSELLLFSSGKNRSLVPETWWSDPRIRMVHKSGVWFRSMGITKILTREGAGVFHGLSNELPFNIKRFDGQKLVTIHDVIHRIRPDEYGMTDRFIYDKKTTSAVRAADAIIAISPQTANDLQEHYDVPREKIELIYQDVDPFFREKPQPETLRVIRQQYALPAAFWLFVGASHPRKNLDGLIEAWIGLAPDDRLPIVVTGRENTLAGRQAMQLLGHHDPSGRALIWLSNVSTAELRSLYHLASGVVYPSHYEGFGLPVLEALHSGTPVAASDTLSFDRWYGKGVVPLQPDDPESMRQALIDLSDVKKSPPPEDLDTVYGTGANLPKLLALYRR